MQVRCHGRIAVRPLPPASLVWPIPAECLARVGLRERGLCRASLGGGAGNSAPEGSPPEQHEALSAGENPHAASSSDEPDQPMQRPRPPPTPPNAPALPALRRRQSGEASSDNDESWTIFPRMSADDERLGSTEGHFTRRLQEIGLLDAEGAVTELGLSQVAPMQARYIHLMINKMLSMNRRYQTILSVVRDVGEHMGAVNVATAMHRLGKLVRSAKAWNPALPERVASRPQYRFLLQRAVEVADELQPRAVANFLWGMAALGDTGNEAVVRRLGRRLMEVPTTELKTQELSNVVWSLVKLEVVWPELWDRMLDSAVDRIDECVPQALSNMTWACAAMHHRHPRFLDAVAASATPRLSHFQSQTLANTLWAFSVLGVYPPEMFDGAGDEIVARFRRSGSASPGARREHGDGGASDLDDPLPAPDAEFGELLDGEEEEAAEASRRHSNEASSALDQDPPRRRSGYASTRGRGASVSEEEREDEQEEEESLYLSDGGGGFSSGDEAAAGSSRSLWRPSNEPTAEFRGQEISNILIAYARGGIVHRELLQTVEDELCAAPWAVREGRRVRVQRLQEEFSSQALANTLWAFATLRWYPARLLPAITAANGRIAHAMTAQELSNSLWSYARFAYHPGRVMTAYLSVIERRLEEFEGQGCTNTLWALGVLKATHSAAFVGLLRRYLRLERAGHIPGELQYNQMLQAVLLAQFEARGGRVAWRPEVDLPENVVDRALEAWASQQATSQLSGFHLDVSEGLKRLGVEHSIEHLVAGNLLSIDIAVIKDGRRIAIEVDGPYHFPVNSRTPLGHTMIRRRLLRAAGWTTVSVPWYDWFTFTTWQERLDYLAGCLKRADAGFGVGLRPTTRTLLSSEFSPGPGEEGAEERAPEFDPSAVPADAGAAPGGTRGGPQGPALEELMSVLRRPNVGLTEGAARRLESYGLIDVVQSVRERRAEPSMRPPSPEAPSHDGLMPKPLLPRNMPRSRQGRFAQREPLPIPPPLPRHSGGDAPTRSRAWELESPPPVMPARAAARAAAAARGVRMADSASADAAIAKVLHRTLHPEAQPNVAAPDADDDATSADSAGPQGKEDS